MDVISEFLLNFTLFGGAVYFWVISLLFVLLLFSFDNNENGVGAFICFTVFSVLIYFWSNIDILSYVSLLNIGLYFGTGLIYALIRTYFFGRSITIPTSGKLDYFKDKLKDNVFRWWFLWPVSLINWILSDLVKDIYNFVYSKLKRVFEGVLEMGIQKEKEE